MPIQVKFSDKPDDVVAVISNCGDVHKVSRLTYLKAMMESTPELKVQFYGSCSPNGRYPGDKAVCAPCHPYLGPPLIYHTCRA